MEYDICLNCGDLELEPKISVLMPVYNGSKYISQALSSVLNQNFKDFELIIIDDGSTDSTLEIIESYKDSRIKLLKNGTNRGLIYSLNAAIEIAQCEYIARMDSDDVALKDRFKMQKKWLDTHPEIGVVGSRAIRIDEYGQPIELMINVYSWQDVHYMFECGMNPLIHSSIMIRTQLIKELGGYRKDFEFAEDRDLWLRVLERSKICNLPIPLLLYRTNSSGIRLSKIIQATHSSSYAYNCYIRKKQDLEELSRKEFLNCTDLKNSEEQALWNSCVELLMLSALEPLQNVLEELTSRGKYHRGVKLLRCILCLGFGESAGWIYRKYRYIRSVVGNTRLGPLLVKLKHKSGYKGHNQ